MTAQDAAPPARPTLPVRVLFAAHAVATAAAGAALIVSPAAIPAAVGIDLPREANLVAYPLGAVELAVAVLSMAVIAITDRAAVRLIAMVFVVMHVATSAVEMIAIVEGASPLVWANVALRVVVAALFAVVALRR